MALHRGDQAIGGVKIAYTQYGRLMAEHEPDARRELNVAGQDLDALGARLSVRLGRSEEAVKAFGKATDAGLEVSRAVGWLEDDRTKDTRVKHLAIDKNREAYTAAAQRFILAACRARRNAPWRRFKRLRCRNHTAQGDPRRRRRPAHRRTRLIDRRWPGILVFRSTPLTGLPRIADNCRERFARPL